MSLGKGETLTTVALACKLIRPYSRPDHTWKRALRMTWIYKNSGEDCRGVDMQAGQAEMQTGPHLEAGVVHDLGAKNSGDDCRGVDMQAGQAEMQTGPHLKAGVVHDPDL